MSFDYKVRDLSLAEAGRHQLRLAEHEMPGLMALREEFGDSQPLKGARIAGSLHMTVQTAVLIETLTALGAEVRWASCNIYSTQDEAAAAVVVGPHGTPEDPQGVPVFAWKGETLDGVLGLHRADPHLARRRGLANMILDDGGDATMLVHKGKEWEAAGQVPPTTEEDSEEFGVISRRSSAAPSRPTRRSGRPSPPSIKGVTEETTTGVHRLYQLAEAGELLFPAINVNDSVTKTKFDNKYGCRHSADRRPQPRHRRAHRRQGRRRRRLRRRGQGLRRVAARPGRPRHRHRDRPDLRAAGGDGGLPGRPLEDVVETADIFVTTTGCFNVITADHMQRMKNKAIVANIGHFDNEIDMAGLAKVAGHHQDRDQAAGARVDLRRRRARSSCCPRAA